MNVKQSKKEDQRNNDNVLVFLMPLKKALTCQEIDGGLVRGFFFGMLSTETLVVDHLDLVGWVLCSIHSSVALYDCSTKLTSGEFGDQVEPLAFVIFKPFLNGVCE